MQLVTTMISFVKDVKDRDKQLRNLNNQLSYVLYKAKQLNQKCYCTNPVHGYSSSTITRGTEMSNKLNQLFKEENMSIKEKIRLSLPFDKTKDDLKQLIENLDKVSNQLKEHTEETSKQAMIAQTKGVKRKINSKVMLPPQMVIREISSHSAEQQQNNQMGPTLENNDIIEMVHQKVLQVGVSIKIKGEEQYIQAIKKKNPELIQFQRTIPIEDHHQILLFTLCRMYFKSVYKELKAVFPDIDRISTQKHFEIIWRRTKVPIYSNSQMKQQSQINQNKIRIPNPNDKKITSLSKISQRKSQKAAEQFLSFPQQTFGTENHLIKGIVLLIREDSKASYLLSQKKQWQKCQDCEVELKNGCNVSGFVLKKGEQIISPLYLNVSFTLPQ